MLISAEFRSVQAMAKLAPTRDTVVISVLDGSERHLRPRLAGFRSVLCLHFEDTYEGDYLHPTSEEWPDEPTPDQHLAYAVDIGERTVTLSDAQRMLEFILRHHHDPEPLRLVAHCNGGISRSPAIAYWAASRLQIPLANINASTDAANRRVVRLLDKAWGTAQAEERNHLLGGPRMRWP